MVDTQLQKSPEIQPGRRLAMRYRLERLIAHGGMATVWLATDEQLRRPVAVKLLHEHLRDPISVERFRGEGKLAAQLCHPGIVAIYDTFHDDGIDGIVLEYVHGRTLRARLDDGSPMSIEEAVTTARSVATALAEAHRRGLVHRDIKPANILVDRTGVVKILDMGLARFFNPDEDDMLTKKFDESVLGTADYLAPEQAIDSSTVDIRADIYGLGGTFYYMLTGFPPFPEGSVAQKLLWHQTKAPKPVRAYRPEVPEGVAAIVDKMMAKDAANRYQSPAELMVALAPWVQTPIPPPPSKLRMR